MQLSDASPVLLRAIRAAMATVGMTFTMSAFRDRERDFRDELSMTLAAIAMSPEARRGFDTALDAEFLSQRGIDLEGSTSSEVIIGGGLHAAVYCAARVRAGFPRPVVLEATRNVGGAFAVSRYPSFRLNSSNRPGKPGLPGEGMSLNYLPGAVIQADEISSDEYSTNSDMAFVVRTTLAQYGNVFTEAKLTSAEDLYSPADLTLNNSQPIRARRVIEATGISLPKIDEVNGQTVCTFDQFLSTFDDPFPLRGLEKVAVIGSGDSARCAVEALLGIGPSGRMSAAGLDYVRRIDWYGSGLPQRCKDWRKEQRPRYARIGAYLPRTFGETPQRLRVIQQRGEAMPTVDGAIVNGKMYDKAIICTGAIVQSVNYGLPSRTSLDLVIAGNTVVAKKSEGTEYYAVGPAAQLEYDSWEFRDMYSSLSSNKVAMFRLAPRTATLATMLGGI